jgi:hypothetical protein
MLILVISSDHQLSSHFGYRNFGHTKRFANQQSGIFSLNKLDSIESVPDLLFFHKLDPCQLLRLQFILRWSSWSLMSATVHSLRRWCVWSQKTSKMIILD